MSTHRRAGEGRIIAPFAVIPLLPVTHIGRPVSIAPSRTGAAHAAGLANAVE
jgi:hypothetical protein